MKTHSSDAPPTNLRIITNLFQPEQLTRARELRLMTKAALADQIGKSAAAIGQFEKGTARPDHQTLAKLALALGFPPPFFARRHLTTTLRAEDCHFRSLRSASTYLRRQAVRTGELLCELLVILESEGVELPRERVSDVRDATMHTDPETAAVEVRKRWGLGLGPIHDPIKLVESFGVRTLPLPTAFEKVDAFSFWQSSTPFIMLDMTRPPSRIHFDVAHELGHLVLHEDVTPGDPDTEREADMFASSFLMPRQTFSDECPSRWRLDDFLALKQRWRVSIAGLVYRSHNLGILSSASYRRAYQILNASGIRRDEPGEWELAPPSVLAKALSLVADDLPLDELAKRLSVHEQHLHELLVRVLPTL